MKYASSFSGVVRAAGVLSMSALAFGACANADSLLCDGDNCGWSEEEQARITALGDLPDTAPTDTSNAYFGNKDAQVLGRKFFWDTRFSGVSSGADALKRPMPFARAPKGQPIAVGCVTCHDLRRGGIDPSTVPGNVSLGGSWTDTNTSTVYNDGFQELVLWAGRADSMWAQATGSLEGAMGNNRLRAGWIVATYYRAEYNTVFTDYQLPMTGTITDMTAMVETTGALAGQCKLNGGPCPSGCRTVQDAAGTATGCFPRFPLDGRPGAKMGCQPGDAAEPYGDAYDCMDAADQTTAVRITVNFGKAVAAFEAQLISRNSAFDGFAADVKAGRANTSTAISAAAKNGARLFVGKAGCSDCHNTPLLSDGKFYNIGIPQTGQGVPTMDDCPKGGVCDCVTPNNCLPFGVVDGLAKLRKNPYLRTSMWSDDPADSSRQKYMEMPLESMPRGGFRTPGLRDVAMTGPYMHTGAIATLEEVVDHYNRGAEIMPNGAPAARIKPLFLSEEEKSELVAFLRTLSGEPLPSDLTDAPTLP